MLGSRRERYYDDDDESHSPAKHEPCRAKEVDDRRVSPRHRLGHSLVCQFSAALQLKHLEVSILAHSHGHVRLLGVQTGPVHGYPGLIGLQ